MANILIWYAGISLFLACAVALYLGLYDLYTIFIDPSKKDSKFGYNFGKTGLGWYFVSAFLPLVNLLTIGLILFSWWEELIKSRLFSRK